MGRGGGDDTPEREREYGQQEDYLSRHTSAQIEQCTDKKTCSLLNYYSLKGIFRQQNFLSRLSLMVLRSNPSQFVIIKSVHF